MRIFKGRFFVRTAFVLSLCTLSIPLPVLAQTEVKVVVDTQMKERMAQQGFQIEYADLRELVKAGNLNIKKQFEDQADEMAMYQEMYGLLKLAQDQMEGRAEDVPDGEIEDKALYNSNVNSLKRSATQIYKTMENMNQERSQKSLEEAADAGLVTAQTLMNSYSQMAWNIAAREKALEAEKASYQDMLLKQTAGSVTDAQVLEAQNQLTRTENSLEGLRAQAQQLRNRLLSYLGLEGREDVTIGTIPALDLSVIDSIDFETESQKAVNNNDSVLQARHSRARGTAQYERRFKKVDEAEGTAMAEIRETYETLQAKRSEYQGALAAFESGTLIWQSCQRKYQAGLISQNEYIQAEADYLEKQASKETASLALVQAYETYCWQVKGTV